MGLDIYLRKCENFDEQQRLTEIASSEAERIWSKITGDKKYEDMTEEEKNTSSLAVKDWYSKNGYDEDGNPTAYPITGIEENDPEVPDHIFKIGYFRSSYNEGGINNVLSALGIPALYEIFEVNKESYYPSIDWISSKKIAESSLAMLQRIIDAGEDFSIAEIGNQFSDLIRHPDPIKDSKTANGRFIEKYREHKNRPKGKKHPLFDSSWFSNRDGHFYLGKPMQVYGIMEGLGCMGKPSVYVIYKQKGKKGESHLKWYADALRIVIKTCDYVLNLPESERKLYRLAWSG